MIRDNFYVLYPEIDKWVCFALLNNLYTFYQLECAGKKYGAGLLKIQRYDIENLHFPNIKTFSAVDIDELKKLGKKLAKTIFYHIMRMFLMKEYPLNITILLKTDWRTYEAYSC